MSGLLCLNTLAVDLDGRGNRIDALTKETGQLVSLFQVIA